MNAFVSLPALLRPTRTAAALRQARCPRPTPARVPVANMTTRITPPAANILLKGNAPPVYLDVRTPAEFAAGHVPASVNVPVTLGGGVPVPTFVQDVEKLVGKDVSLIVGCKSGKRSTMAINILEKAGFASLTEVDGGFDAWSSDSSLPVHR